MAILNGYVKFPEGTYLYWDVVISMMITYDYLIYLVWISMIVD